MLPNEEVTHLCHKYPFLANLNSLCLKTLDVSIFEFESNRGTTNFDNVISNFMVLIHNISENTSVKEVTETLIKDNNLFFKMGRYLWVTNSICSDLLVGYASLFKCVSQKMLAD